MPGKETEEGNGRGGQAQFFLYLASWIGSTTIKHRRHNCMICYDMKRCACECGHKIGSGCFRIESVCCYQLICLLV